MSIVRLAERAVRWLDDVQQTRTWLAFPIGTIRKYTDDRASALAGLVTFHVFLGLLPLLVVALTVLGQVLEGSESLRDAAIDSTLGQFPVIGPTIKEDLSALQVDGWLLVVSIVGLLWTATGIYHSLQHALNQVWNVEGVYRQGFASRMLRSLLLFVLFYVAAIGTSVLREVNPFREEGSWPVAIVATVIGIGVATVLLLAVFRLAVAHVVSTGRLVPAAVLAALLWELLQRIGAWLISDRLVEASDLYGAIGVVIVALFWINLLARAAIFANEWAVVAWRGLFPRRIAQPPLTDADRRVLVDLVRNERRRPEQHIDVRFDDDDEEPT